MSRKVSGLISAFVTVVLVVSFLSPAAAASPQISVVSLSKASLSRGDSIRVEYRVTDDGNGCCNPHDVYVYDPNGAWVTRVQGVRVSGTDSNSLWGANITIPVNSVGQNWGTALIAGTYTFRTQTTDAQNNWTDLVLLGTASVVVASPTPTPTPSASPTPTPTPTPSASPTPTPTPTPSASPTPSATPTPTPTVPAAPQISVISLSKSSLSRGESIRVEYRITDDGNGCCNPHDVYVYDPNGAWVTRVQGTKISGTSSNSTWRADITIPVNSVGQNQGTPLMAGTYTFRTQTTDSQINWTDLVLLGTASVVVGAAAPQISVVSLSKKSLSRGESIRVEYRITDDGICCNPHDVYVYDPNGAWVTRVQGVRISGTDANSLWGANITIPVNSVGQNWGTALIAGTYTFRTQTTDSLNNFSQLVLLGTASVVVASPSPSPSASASPSVPAAPQISVISLSKSSLSRGESIRVEYRITDDGNGCCNAHDVYVYDPNGAWVTRVQGTKISGTSSNSTWRADITIPVNSVGQNQGTPLMAGTYTFRTQTTDSQINWTDLVLLGTASVVVASPTPTPSASPSATPRVSATPSATPRVSATPSATPRVSATPSATPSALPSAIPSATPSALPSAIPSATPRVSATPRTSTTPRATATPTATATPAEEIDLEPEEEVYESSIEAKFTNGRTRFVVNGIPNTKYKVEATFRLNKATFAPTTNSDGEVIFRSTRNLKNYKIKLILVKEVVATATVE